MGSSVLWSWIAALSCLLCMGEVQCDCTEDRMGMEGGTYTLTKQLESGTMLVYNCPRGYYPYPALARLCQASTWKPAPTSFSPQRCKVVECPDPNVLEQGTVMPPQEKYFVDNETTFECYSGYRLRGSFRRECLPNGKWSGSTPICSRDSGDTCPDPGIPPGASRSGNTFGIDDKVKYSCNNNMILMGSSERVCQENGQWTGIEPACYYKHTYDSSLEAAEAFRSGIGSPLALWDPVDGTRRTKKGALNIYIAVDISQSIDKEYVTHATSAISRLIEKLAAFSVTPNYEIIFFSSKVVEVVNIIDFVTGNETLNILDELRNIQLNSENTRGTNLNLAFNTFLERMELMKRIIGEEEFKEHRHVFLLFTDGGINMGGSPAPTVEKIKNLVNSTAEQRQEYLDIFIFAVGGEIFDGDLQPLTAGVGGRRYFRMKYIGDLAEEFDRIVDENHLCGFPGEKTYPWLASIIIWNHNTGALRYCLGSLVSPRFVLTAAHCFTFEDKPEHVTVDIGDRNSRDAKVKRFILHPEFNISAKVSEGVMEFYDYDVALIQLEEDVQISNNARPIYIPCTQGTSDALRLVGESTCEQQEQLLLTNGLEKLQFLTKTRGRVNVKTAYTEGGYHRHECIKYALQAPGITTTNVTVAVTDNFLCSGGRNPLRSHVTCKGDGGGAVFKDYLCGTVQVAVVSWRNKDLCGPGSGLVESDETSRDFHINLFRVVPFLKSILGNETQTDYVPLKFLSS